MSDQELSSEDEEIGPVESDESDVGEVEENDSIQTLSSLKESLKKSRWNVFMFLGLAFLMFGFALFPMPMDADFEYGTAEKDLGFVWGPSLGGEDIMDVPYEVTVNVKQLPATTGNITLQVFVVQIDDCTDPEAASNAESRAQAGNDHGYQYGFVNSPVEGKSYTFDFDLDMGQYCLNTKAVGQDGTIVDPSRTNLEVTGKLWPNQVIAGIPGLVFLGLSTFAFIGAQKIGKQVKAILEDKKVTEEQMVLADARRQRIVAGPGGPPKPTAGPAGPHLRLLDHLEPHRVNPHQVQQMLQLMTSPHVVVHHQQRLQNQLEKSQMGRRLRMLEMAISIVNWPMVPMNNKSTLEMPQVNMFRIRRNRFSPFNNCRFLNQSTR